MRKKILTISGFVFGVAFLYCVCGFIANDITFIKQLFVDTASRFLFVIYSCVSGGFGLLGAYAGDVVHRNTGNQ